MPVARGLLMVHLTKAQVGVVREGPQSNQSSRDLGLSANCIPPGDSASCSEPEKTCVEVPSLH